MSEEKKELTATQLFSNYMRSVDKVRDLAKGLAAETAKAENLSQELATRYGIYVTGSKPRLAPKRPDIAPGDRPVMNDDDAAEGPEYEPPAQYHSDAPELSGEGSAEVAEIRQGAELSAAEADSEALASEGSGMMDILQRRMKGAPSVVPGVGEHQQGGASTERSNAEGGPVTQKPVEE